MQPTTTAGRHLLNVEVSGLQTEYKILFIDAMSAGGFYNLKQHTTADTSNETGQNKAKSNKF